MDPTPEQQRIIQHISGHALVFAVAGSGKTATMIERILHLIRHAKVRSVRILACTFSKEATRTIEERLAQHPETTGVKVSTLHALAFSVIVEAGRMGFTEQKLGEANFSRRLFLQARRELIAEDTSEKSGFHDIQYKDFETYLCVQKGNLRLPYAPEDLPVWGHDLISPPDRGIELYAELYERHDELRRAEGKLDYDDCIVQAWMLMARFPELHQVIKDRWDHIHVDEFQDVNLAQSEMLHLIAAECDSYMAIGDDDQTVYQWRGANPKFILDFEKRYNAVVFTLSTNFRCPMGVIALSDLVIQENQVRAPKRLRASRGDNGTYLHTSSAGKAAHVAIKAIEEGRNPRDLVILVRAYAQTGEIEQVFLDRGVPYLVVGGVPFYQRDEVGVLLVYLRLALADLDAARDVSITQERRLNLLKDWKRVSNTPNRFLRNQTVDELARGLWRGGSTLVAALRETAPTLRAGAQRATLQLAEAFGNLTDDLALAEGKDALLEFAEAIQYAQHLVKTAPTREFGEERSGSIRALAEMAKERSLGQLVLHIEQLTSQGRYVDRLSAAEHDDVDRVTLMTAFRAKGLQWPVVIVPDCKDGLYRIKPSADQAAAEEERRVFYVAMTRAQEELHLIVDTEDPTAFLTKVEHETVVHAHVRLAQLMARDPGSWSARETFEAGSLLRQYGHEQYVQVWLDAGYRERLLSRIDALSAALSTHAEQRHGQTEVASVLSLAAYAKHGPATLAEDTGLRDFTELDTLVRDLNDKYAPRPVNPSGQPATQQRSTGTALRPDQIRVGMEVQHPRFGTGEVLSVRGEGDKLEATVKFETVEQPKRMIVVFATLYPAPADSSRRSAVQAPIVIPARYTAPMGGYWAAQPRTQGSLLKVEEDERLPFD
ncbi:ATP-dependent helicase [Deinococcus aquatilis]|uniref:ATP-dependent helicase n=1 Tax=Deinococcus aquatilis TaxID=519440 RepID=UPI00037348C3|nr:ATP-dependent helicase [Deinococcus aquatilis]